MYDKKSSKKSRSGNRSSSVKVYARAIQVHIPWHAEPRVAAPASVGSFSGLRMTRGYWTASPNRNGAQCEPACGSYPPKSAFSPS